MSDDTTATRAEEDRRPLGMRAPLRGEKIPRYTLLGLPLNALSKDELVDLVAEAVRDEQSFVIGNHNLHSLYVAHNDSRMRQFYAHADFAHVDGMSVVLLGRLSGLPLTRRERTGYMDLLPLLMRRAVTCGWRIFYLGSKPGVAEKGARILRAQYPGLQIAVQDGYFNSAADSTQNLGVLAAVRDFAPHVLLVGMGMPRQESWIMENRHNLAANAIFCCGALIDYVAGEIPTPPRWIGQLGFEWLYRLIAEPRRLSFRYLVEPWYVLKFVVQQRFKAVPRDQASAGDEGSAL